jgi:hypothetical protein
LRARSVVRAATPGSPAPCRSIREGCPANSCLPPAACWFELQDCPHQFTQDWGGHVVTLPAPVAIQLPAFP